MKPDRRAWQPRCLVINADDRSAALDTRLTWSMRPNLDLTLMLRGHRGGRDSEFGRRRGAGVVQLQHFF